GFGKSAPQDIWVVNQSGYPIYSVKISPHSSGSWGTNTLSLADVLEYGVNLDFCLSGYNIFRFNLHVDFSSVVVSTFRDVYNFCDISGVEIDDDQTMRVFNGNPE